MGWQCYSHQTLDPASFATAGSLPPVLAVFLDGLGADAMAHMPFLSGQPTVRRLRTELGYSITCHASMYTGLRPDRHGLWFVWRRDPQHSPFRWLRRLRFLDVVDNIPLHVAATKITRRFTRTSSWFGIPYPVHVPWRYLPELDISERRLWHEPGYLATSPTIFDLLRADGVPFDIVGMARGPAAGLRGIEAWEPRADLPALTYLFAGDIDHASHAHGQGSHQVRSLLEQVDSVIARRFAAVESIAGEATLIVWSDHGHHQVRRLDPRQLLNERLDLGRYLHVIDTNFIRLWIDDVAERRAAIDALNATGVGHVLTEEELERHRVRMSDDRYGNVIFYLELPYAFSRTIWGFGRRLASAHGYLPDHPGSDGVFVSSRPAAEGAAHIADLAPTLLDAVGIQLPDGLDGRSLWHS